MVGVRGVMPKRESSDRPDTEPLARQESMLLTAFRVPVPGRRRIPLGLLSESEEGEVVELRGGRGMRRRLLDMGLSVGAPVKVLVSNPPGPVLVGVRGTRLALGRGLAMKILVEIGE